MIEGKRWTVYPTSCMVRVDGRLFRLDLAVALSCASMFVHLFDQVEHRLSKPFEMQGMMYRRIRVFATNFEGFTGFIGFCGQICDGHVLKIQAWWRWMVRERRERRLGLAMGLHARLGLASILHALCDDHLRLILSA